MTEQPVPQTFDELLDTSGLNCPLPLLKTKQALNKLSGGQLLKVIATDAGSWRDIQVFVNNSVHDLVAADDTNDVYSYWIRKGI
ncbi:sulfurtransferase TusA family protein [Litoribacillus peritrichatus]|uniref:Sulfurtransferase TusA family protein n=1 Tax=Litoribacillus peritrichatus TaxID=718191 RepID=A0ABP7N8I0_9GAMM